MTASFSTHLLHFSETHQFSPMFLDYISQKQELKEFYDEFPSLDAFEKQIRAKKFDTKKREVLVQALQKQYKNTAHPPQENLHLLQKETTFTLTTGHQLNIYTGTLYFHYKIQTVINACKLLKQKYPQYDFVPVYWAATEDHDLEEIASFNLFGEKYSWQTEQTGAVGRMNTKGLADLEFREGKAKEIAEFYRRAEENNQNLAQATRDIVHSLYGNQGLVIVDGDDKALKNLFVPAIKKELLEQKSHHFAEKSSQKLDNLGYKTQVTPREINLFYLDEGLRERIFRDENSGKFGVLNTELVFSEEEILNLVEKSPEKFSPNVALRPLYQEIILPNLSYTGGPGELAYWLQLKAMFDAFDVPFPILLPRNFVLFVPKRAYQKMQKTGLGFNDIFKSFDELRINYAKNNAQSDISLFEEKQTLEKLFQEIETKSIKTDATLQKAIAAEHHRTQKRLEHLSNKLRKAEERRLSDAIGQIKSVKQQLFPKGSLQERYDNFLSFIINDEDFLIKIQALLKPLDLRFLVVFEEE